jgi:DnaK suppressor protein
MTTHRTEPIASRPPTVDGDVSTFDVALVEAATARQDQLRDLPDADDDPVVAAQRDALRQTLTDIAAARQRLAAGTFGTCSRCRGPIPAERLEFRPWVTACVTCSSTR